MLIPYVELENGWTITDDQIIAVWLQLVDDGTSDIVFYDSKIKDALDFLGWVKNPDNLMVFLIAENKIMGVAWLNGLAGNQAFGHFAMFKAAAGKYTLDLGKEVLDYWFSMPGEDGKLLDIVLGMIPEFNSKALHYIEKLGFKQVGRIPKIIRREGRKEAAILSYYEG